jgi:hypothetical protein
MSLSKKHNIELFDNISYIIKFISEISNVAMEDGQYIFIRNIGCASWADILMALWFTDILMALWFTDILMGHQDVSKL